MENRRHAKEKPTMLKPRKNAPSRLLHAGFLRAQRVSVPLVFLSISQYSQAEQWESTYVLNPPSISRVQTISRSQ